MWTIGAGGRVLIAEPYDMATEAQQDSLAELTEYARTLGLVVEEFPELSVWYPPYTSLVIVCAPSTVIQARWRPGVGLPSRVGPGASGSRPASTQNGT